MAVENLITEHIDIWTSAVKTRSASGRGSSKKLELYGVKKLRELILELAVRGKLVPQNPNDEPASVLLERIAAEKALLVKEKKIKKPKSLAPIEQDDISYRLPNGWAAARLGNICNKLTDGSHNPAKDAGLGYPMYSSQNVQFRKIDFSNPSRYVDEQDYQKEHARTQVQSGDILLTIVGTLGRAAVVPEDAPDFVLQRSVAVIESALNSDFLTYFFAAPICIKYFEEHGKGTAQKGIYLGKLSLMPVFVPPLKEQHRIVAKVDELMALCDQLEQQTEASIEAHQVLVTTLLDTLTNSANADELMQNWARISEHFDTLFTTEESIDQLKQAILQLAVMGKLVPQDPSDEPVNKLLERIKNHQLDRVQRKEIQKPKKASVSTKLKMDIPKCWKSLLLNDLVFVTKLAGFEYTKYINLEDAGDVAVIRAQNVRPFKPDLENLKFIDNETSLSLPRSAIDRPSLLVTFIGAGIGDVCVFNEEKRWHLAPNVAKIEPYADLNLEYLCIYLNSPVGRGELFKSMKSTAQPSLSMTTIREIWVALPPVDEQKRIVTEVNKLFTLCDQLAVRLKASQVVQLHLTDVIAEQAV
ncbi:restriction endonuclease subunit S [Vibrio vulnificus]|uniref:restriction endonuclease subunit S n=1 Tax=Vibrio vulnificus TaxID=672 RepID=UPI00188C661E|nr:restriction endonuclease subunit S [Vibrio vulnificus]MBF4499129.1 restriction endonuclease subunit S [Vibrio vulnificus]